MIGFFGNSDTHDIWRDFERLMRDFDSGWPSLRQARSTQPGFTEHEDRYELLVPAPGMSSDGVELQVHGGVLSLRAQTKPALPEGYRATHLERPGYEYARSYRLPTNADTERVSAKLTNGILSVVVPKVVEAQPKRIAVKVS